MKEREIAFDNMCERIKGSHEELDFKEGFKLAINELIEAWEDIHRLEDRIDKAIEYIKRNAVRISKEDYELWLINGALDKLLDILKGDSNEN